MTVVWGVGSIFFVAIGTVLDVRLTIKQYMIFKSVEGYALLGGLGLSTVRYGQRSKARGEARRAGKSRQTEILPLPYLVLLAKDNLLYTTVRKMIVVSRIERPAMLRLTLAFAAAALVSPPSYAAPCRDAKGKFMKCADKAAATGGVTKDAKGKCHIALGPKKGQFTKC